MSTQNSSPDLPITVKVALAGDTRRFKMSLKDVGPSVFENKVLLSHVDVFATSTTDADETIASGASCYSSEREGRL